MKQETKELIDWIVKQINLAKENCIDPAHKDGYPEYEADWNKAMDFLHSLPEIESKLCRGGYIQDKNGTPCCEGDSVRFTITNGYYEEKYAGKNMDGILKWDRLTGRFILVTKNRKFGLDALSEFEFEKIEAVECQK